MLHVVLVSVSQTVNLLKLSFVRTNANGLLVPSYLTAFLKVSISYLSCIKCLVFFFLITVLIIVSIISDTQQAAYHVVAGVQYRALGAVSNACLPQYKDLLAQYDNILNERLSQRCSAVNVNINVTFVKAMPSLLDENVVKMDFVLAITPAIRQTQLYDLCGSTLNLIFDLSVPYASALIEPLLNVSSIGNQCPPLRAIRSSITRGFTCSVGEVLNMDTNDVPRCREYFVPLIILFFSS